MALDGFTVTDAGRELLARAALGETLTFSRGAVGKGVLPSGMDKSRVTELCDPVCDLTVQEVFREGDSLHAVCGFVNTDENGDPLPAFAFREAGLFAAIGTEEALLAYGTLDTPTYIPDTPCEFEIEFVLAAEGAEAIRGGLRYVTQAELATCVKASAGVLAGRLSASPTAAASLGTAQLRSIHAGTTDLTAGVSTLADGEIYLYYV